MTEAGYGSINNKLFAKLNTITPNSLSYYPCQIVLKSGEKLDCVYLVELEKFIKTWGRSPSEKDGKRMVLIEDVIELSESPSRVPLNISEKIDKLGESGMGYNIVKFTFKGGLEKIFVGVTDFIDYPQGKTKEDIIDVELTGYSNDCDVSMGPDFYYCVYSGM